MYATSAAAALVLALALPLLGVSGDEGGEEHPQRAKVVAYAKRIDVQQLDPALHPERLEHFLNRVLPKDAGPTWGSSDCENKPPDFPRPADTPLCASIHAAVLGGWLRLEVVTGSHGKPVEGQPRIEKLYILLPPPKTARTFSSLSEFAAASTAAAD